jgi:putative SOS response-associated peptidase YedK
MKSASAVESESLALARPVGNDRTWEEIVALYRLRKPVPPHNLPPRYNICPTDPVDVVTERDGKRDFGPMRWGLIPYWWSKSPKELRAATFNARAETVADKPFFRGAFRRTRCLIPASGYYEWQHTAGGGKQPWYFTRRDGEPLTFAGLWDEWKDKATGETLKIVHDDHHQAEWLCRRSARPHARNSRTSGLRHLAQ